MREKVRKRERVKRKLPDVLLLTCVEMPAMSRLSRQSVILPSKQGASREGESLTARERKWH